jgi:hypothetical protein
MSICNAITGPSGKEFISSAKDVSHCEPSLPALPARVVLQPPSRRLEGIADYNVNVLVLWICFKVLLPFFFVAALDGAVQTRLVPHDDLAPWHAQLNADVKLFSQRVMAVRDLDDHTATCDAPVKFIEFFGFLLHSRRDRVGRGHVTERDLYWQDHDCVFFFLTAPPPARPGNDDEFMPRRV